MNNSFDISKITKMWNRSAIIAVAILLGCLTILGFPPTVGFYAKHSMFVATFSENNIFVGILVVAGTILSASYLISLLYHVFFVPIGPSRVGVAGVRLPIGVSISLLILCFLLVCSSGALDYALFALLD